MAETKAVYKYWEVSNKDVIFFPDMEYVEFQFHTLSFGVYFYIVTVQTTYYALWSLCSCSFYLLCSAFMIGDGKLLTNAHCVEHDTQVMH